MRVALLFALLGAASAENVVVLTKDNFQSTLDSNKHVLVEFYAPWCGHCKQLAPEYEKAATTLKEKETSVVLANVDATVDGDLAKKFNVGGYPTLKWFVNGEPSEYDGGRTAETIVEWIESMSGDAVTKVTEEPAAPEAGKPVFIVRGEVPAAFEEVASTYRREAKWLHLAGSAGKCTLQHPGEEVLEVADCGDAAKLKEFFLKNKVPLFGKLDGETFSKYMENKEKGLLWSLYKMEKGELDKVAAEHRGTMTEVAKAFSDKLSVTYTDTDQFADALDNMLGVKKENLPALVLQKQAGSKRKFVFDGEHDVATIKQWVEDVYADKIVAKLKSEPKPESNEGPVRVIVGETLQEEVFTADKDVLLEVYAPWCGHCKSLAPAYEKLAAKVRKEGLEDVLTIAKMDGTLNDSPNESIEWSGFPTILFIKAGSDKPINFDGGRDAKEMWKWIKKNHSKSEELTKRVKENKEKKEKEDGKEEL